MGNFIIMRSRVTAKRIHHYKYATFIMSAVLGLRMRSYQVLTLSFPVMALSSSKELDHF